MRNFAFLFLLAFVLFGCKSAVSFTDPTVVLNAREPVTFKGLDSNGLNLLAKLDVTNNDSDTIPKTRIEWELFINDFSGSFTKGTLEKTSSIGGGETVTMDVPVNIGIQQLFQQGPSLITLYLSGVRELDYTLKMKISFPIPVLKHFGVTREVKGKMPLPSPV